MADATATRVANVMNIDKPNVVEKAVEPKNPASPSMTKNVVLGGMIGAILMIGILVVLYMMDDTIKDSERCEKISESGHIGGISRQEKEAEDRRVL